jgi:hypothetical protein
MKKRSLVSLVAAVMLISPGSGALASPQTSGDAATNISGNWSGDIPRGGGNVVHADFDFEVNDHTLGGIVHALDLDLPVKNGKIEGNHVSFNIGDSKGDYSGEIEGDVIRMTVKYSGGETGRVTLDFLVKRVAR